jgi:glycosyltransferase involved in cell wall biosynthesis
MTGRPKILLLIDNLNEASGGAERFMMGLATHLPARRFDVRTLSTRTVDTSSLEQLKSAGVEHVNLGRRAKLDCHRLLGLARLLRRERIDVLHAHKFGSNVWGTVIGTACRVPAIIAHEHTWSYEGQPLRKLLDGRVIGRLADRFVAVSSADRERMVRLEGVPVEKTLVIPAAYVPRASPSRRDLRAELGLPPDTPLVGTAVQMRPQKALHVLLEAHARVVREVPQAHLVIAGEGPTRESLERWATDLGLGRRAVFLGVQKDVEGILRSLDVAALSSDFEGTPLLAFECMATDTPLVATDVGGLRDVVEDGVSGVLVPRRNPAALAHAIAALLQDPQRRTKLAAAAHERLAPYTIDAVACRFADLYDELLAR